MGLIAFPLPDALGPRHHLARLPHRLLQGGGKDELRVGVDKRTHLRVGRICAHHNTVACRILTAQELVEIPPHLYRYFIGENNRSLQFSNGLQRD